MDLKAILYFLAVLSVLVLVHEWGHFFVAKLCKMRVDDFSLFFGPRLVRLGTKNGTEYNIRTIPLGGFVKIAGMEPEDLTAPINLPSTKTTVEARERKIILRGLSEEAFEGIQFENVSEGILEAAARAVGDDARLTSFGKRELEALATSHTTVNEDERRFLQTILSTEGYQPDPNGYNQKPLYQRAATIFAGPFVSLAFGYLLFCVMGFTVGLPTDHAQTLPIIESLAKDKPAAQAGLLPGDRILEINGIKLGEDATPLLDIVHNSIGKPVTLIVSRDKITKTYTLTPYADTIPDENGKMKLQGRLGFSPAMKMVFAHYDPISSVKRGTELINLQVGGTLHMFGHPSEAKENVGGIISIGKIINQNSKEGIAHVLLTAGMLSISLGIMNLLPIPILDGGHLLLLAIEGIRRRKLTAREIYAAQLVGASIIAVLFIFVMYNDISRWFIHPPKP